jgi:ribonuclease-3
MFSIEAVVDGIVCGLGRDFNKKSAEKSAAEKPVNSLKFWK